MALAAGSALGLIAVASPTVSVADDAGRPVTVAWSGGNDAWLQEFQPERDPESIHYEDFENVEVTVSRTEDLVDEVLSVRLTGMTGPTLVLDQYLSSGGRADFGANFIQAMQCWGDPAAEDFYKNCQWGAWVYTLGNAAANPKVADRFGQISSAGARGNEDYDIPFRAYTGAEFSSLPLERYGKATINEVLSADTSNERTAAADGNGVAAFAFEAQSAAAQPYLGCGNPEAGERCWLVIVPRGLHHSPPRENCMTTDPPMRDERLQQGSPINPQCDYWGNRMVIPLDFRPTGTQCAAGGTERRTNGTEAIAAAFGSWQTELCRRTGQAYTFSTSADGVARGNLATGLTGLAFTSRPLTAETVIPAGAADGTDLSRVIYAPVAVTAAGIAFNANVRGHIETHINLNARLLAKWITGSYALDQPLREYAEAIPGGLAGPWVEKSSEEVGTSYCNNRITNDPEFRVLNPNLTIAAAATLTVTGPQESDSAQALWDYIQADDAAREFLSGEPDDVRPGDENNCGMTVNPFYLPLGHPDARVPELVEVQRHSATAKGDVPTLVIAETESGGVRWRDVGLAHEDGTPLSLANDPVASFAMADETPMPAMLEYSNQYRYDQLQAHPYATGLAAAARMVFRGDSGSKTSWDNSRNDGPNLGVYISNGMSSSSNVYKSGFTDTPNADAYQLPLVSLQVPNSPGLYVDADDAGLTAALNARTVSEVEGVEEIEVGSLPAAAYPLTSIVYAAVNLDASDAEARTDYANLIEYAVTDGQVSGHSTGQLPVGYLPLTQELRDRALAAVEVLRTPDEPSPTPSTSSTPSASTTPSSTPTPSPSLTPSDTPTLGADGRDTLTPTTPAPKPSSSRKATATPSPTPSVKASTNTSGGHAGAPTAPSGPPPPEEDPLQQEAVLGEDEVAEGGVVTSQRPASVEAAPAVTPASGSPAAGALGGGLVTGLAGAIAGPVLLRRREAQR
jgi:hypothetical protein